MRIAFIGHSHVNNIMLACEQQEKKYGAAVVVVQLRKAVFGKSSDLGKDSTIFENCDQEKIARHVEDASKGAALTVLCPTGNEHTASALINIAGNNISLIKKMIENSAQNYSRWLEGLAYYTCSSVVVLPPPPPIESGSFIRANPGVFSEKLTAHGVAPAQGRLHAWLYQKNLIQKMADACGIRMLALPKEVFSDRGFLHEQFWGKDPSHANKAYGELILRYIINFASESVLSLGGRQHPYRQLPGRAFWKQAVGLVPYPRVDPVTEVPFKITPRDKVATAGSCFAQHISKRIRSGGLQFLVTEHPADDLTGTTACCYYDFSARYGNIYTARQLLQLFDRAFGHYSPVDSYWELPDNRFCDPFRPRIEPDGFPSIDALVRDRRRHLQAVRQMFRQLDIFVFTLGLTECWVSRLDGAAYPLAPGVAGGTFDTSRYKFVNFNVNEVVADLKRFVHKLRLVNPKAKMIMTVSPVPLTATYESQHVLAATTYSKSVLRVAAEMVSRSCQGVCYFPSFEIINGNFNRGRYYGPDLRSITNEGVDHVMSVFMRHFTEGGGAAIGPLAVGGKESAELDEDAKEMMALAEAACDEELLEKE